jgi:hypothetical protein
MDGPSHFERGDGQVYVKDDWDRQGALETAGWNFYRISYFDWTKDQETEHAALSEYIQEYFADKSNPGKTSVLRELEKETVAPEESPKDMYVTDFSDESVDSVTPIQAAPETSRVKRTNTSKNKSAKPSFSIGDREVNQAEFEKYLSGHQQSNIEMRYQSMRAGSAKYWRTIRLDGYDDTYLYSKHENATYPIKYRRDRVIEFR